MSAHQGAQELSGELSNSLTLLELMQRSAERLESLSQGVSAEPAVLRQEAESLRQVGAHMGGLLKGWALIAELSNRLLNLPLDEVEQGIRAALEVLGRHSEVQRCYVFLLTESGRQLGDAYEWCAPGVKPHDLASLRGVPVEAFPWSMGQWLQGKVIVVTAPAALPEQARPEQQTCEVMQIDSYVNAPLFLGGRMIGWLGYDSVGAPRTWSPEELRMMDLACGVIVNALERKRRDELRFREKELEQRAQSMGILAAGLAHEINNPLSYTSGNLSYLKELLAQAEDLLPPEVASECQQVLSEALEGAGRVRRIVADLKSLTSTDVSDEGPVDLKAVIDGTLRMASNQMKHRAQLVRAYREGLPPVKGTASKLGQVLLNLVLNATQAVPEGHAAENQVTVAVEPGEEVVVLKVSDTGCGIAPDALPRIFDPFFTTRKVGEGMGMGLAISRSIIQKLGGRISVQSEPGKGTTVEVVLPRAAQARAPSAPQEEAARGRRRHRILMVDDEPKVLDLLRRVLRDHELVAASNGRQAIELLEADPHFHLILCDLMMPELTGMDVYQHVCAHHPELRERIVFISGGAFSLDTRRFLEQVSNQVLTKPFEIDRLRALAAAGQGGELN